ncbi:ParA family protein [Klebsiella pneumoniae]|uniref:ParA family protein n=2 Tax=Klebsiella pneumoniae TaxID=573 RepID=UPI000D01962B|nr:ParA family protein [Klebsiella pneumoniae]QLA37182.1 ParA family protein [Klebsiella pneumoniae]
MVTLSLFNNKGGVGKTTLTWNLSVALAAKGKSVLLIDFDPQCNLSIATLGDENFARLLEKNAQVPFGQTIRAFGQPYIQQNRQPEVIISHPKYPMPQGSGQFDIVAGDFWLNNLSDTLNVGTDLIAGTSIYRFLMPHLISQAAEQATDIKYDYVLIDLPPSFNTLVRSALYCSDYFIVPCTADMFSAYCIGLIGEMLPKFATDWDQGTSRYLSGNAADSLLPTKGKPKFAGWVFNGFDMRKPQGSSVSAEVGADLAHRNVISDAVENNLIPSLRTIGSYNAVPDFVTKDPVAKVEDMNVMAPDSIIQSVPLKYLQTVRPTNLVLTAGRWAKNQRALMDKMIAEHDKLADHVISNCV